ncbi:protein shisa-4-like [Branchiostoma floridae]|uniref:Protein shisa-4-like n=1 Tax=Branchiostoma floridae TaxID=7739 RepID=A0A9J7LPG6_BRAFL|nr:protein shisa-4-like [Branchiostoma floridae]
MFLYLLVLVLAVSVAPCDAEWCSSYTWGGHHQPGFNCPGRYDDYDEIYCCGTSRNKYCCDDCWDKVYGACHRFSVGGKVGVGLAVGGVLFIVLALGYCCRAKQLRQRNRQRQTVSTVPYPDQEQPRYPTGAMSYLPPPAGASAYPQSSPTGYPQPPPGGFVAAPPPYPGGDAAYPPAYPGGSGYPVKQQP